MPRNIPVFLAQGTTDEIIRPQVTQDYMRRLCKGGIKVQMLVMPNVGHAFAGRDSAPAAVDWMTDRFVGFGAPSDCNSG